MPSYKVTGPDGKKYKVTVPEGATSDDAIAYVKNTYYGAEEPEQPPVEKAPPEETSAGGQFARTVGLGVAPSAAAMAGFGAGAANPLALAADPYTFGGASLVSGLIGAGIAAYGAGKLQEKAIEAAPETAKALGISKEQMERGAREHPTASKLGELATTLGTFELGPERALLSGLAAKETRAAAAREIAKQSATNAGIMGVQDVATQAMSDRPFDMGELGESALMGAVLGKPRNWAQRAETFGRSATTGAAERALGAGEAQTTTETAPAAPPAETPPETPISELAPSDRVIRVLSAEGADVGKSRKTIQEETGLTPSQLSGAIFSLKDSGDISYDTRTKKWTSTGRPAERVRTGEQATPPAGGGGSELPVPLTKAGEPSAAGLGGEGLESTTRPSVQPDVGAREGETPLTGAPKATATHTFTTSRGSTYTQFADGTTIRNRSGKNHVDTTTGLQPKSGKTIYLDAADVNKIGGIVQNPDIATRLVPELDPDNKPTGRVKLELTEDYGPKKAGTVLGTVPYSTEPAVGKSPVEIWRSESPVGDAGSGIHFGNKITEVTAATPPAAPKSMTELRSAATDLAAQESPVKQTMGKLRGNFYETLVKNVQDERRKITKLQEDLKSTRMLKTVGEDKNDIANEISTSANKTAHIVNTEVKSLEDNLYSTVEDYARANNKSFREAQDELDGIALALHEPLRRNTKFVREVTLTPEAAAEREQLLKAAPSANTKEAQDAIYNRLQELAANHTDPSYGRPTDIGDKSFNVLPEEYTPSVIKAEIDRYQNLPADKREIVDRYRKALGDVTNRAKELNREANYWTPHVDNVVGTYGWGDTYVPVKGMPGVDRKYETNTTRLSGELADVPAGFEGKTEEFNSPTMQSIAELHTAAGRAGRKDVTKVIKNLVNDGIITTKGKPEKFTFEQRNDPNFDESKVEGRDKIVHHNADGSIEVYTIANPELLEAIKRPFHEMSTLTKVGNKLTGAVGQGFTRFAPPFAPKNFIRDSITNAFQILAKEGPAQAAEYIGAVTSHVLNNGLMKASRFSRIKSRGDKEAMDRLYASGDKTYQEIIELDKYGGSSTHRMSFQIGKDMAKLAKATGPNRVVKDKSSFATWMDSWNDAFELSARTGAYTARKQHNIAEAKKNNLNVNDPKVMEDIKKEAAAFALNLLDFSKVGKYGREISAMYMFTRPSFTGAVNAIDALRPAFQFDTKKAFARLEPEIQAKFDTTKLAEEIRTLEQSATPDQAKITALKEEIGKRQDAYADFEKQHRSKQMTALGAASFAVATGAALYHMAAAAAGEDSEGRNRVSKDDMSRWTRDLRLPVLGEHDFFNVPWGYGVSGLMSLGAQFAAMQSVGMPMKKLLGNVTQIATDSYLPIPVSKMDPTKDPGLFTLDSIMPSIARPVTEFITNTNAYGSPIYNSRAGKYLDAYSGSSRSSDMHRAISEFFLNNFGMDISPDTVSFVMNSYAGGPAGLLDNINNLTQVAKGTKEFDPRTDAFVLRGFIGTEANFDAEKFAEAKQKIEDLSRSAESIKAFGSPDKIRSFYDKNPRAEILIAMYNQGANGALRNLGEIRNKINRDTNLTPKQRKQALDDIDVSINYVKKGLVDRFEQLGLK